MDDIDELIAHHLREIEEAPIEMPQGDQYVDRCWFSRTGWAIHTATGACLCKPAVAP